MCPVVPSSLGDLILLICRAAATPACSKLLVIAALLRACCLLARVLSILQSTEGREVIQVDSSIIGACQQELVLDILIYRSEFTRRFGT